MMIQLIQPAIVGIGPGPNPVTEVTEALCTSIRHYIERINVMRLQK